MNGISFGTIHSYNDLGLILSSCEISPAEPKTIYVDIPGADGSLDLTEALGDVVYKMRECIFKFTVPPGISTFENKKTEVSNKLNGRTFNITLDKDPNYYYVGRCSVDRCSEDLNIGYITVKAIVKPYKYKQDITTVTSDLTADYITLTLTNDRMKTVPEITVTKDTLILFNDNTYSISAGTHKILDIQLVEGKNILKAKLVSASSGSISIAYQEGAL